MLIGLMLLSLSGFHLAAPTPVAAANCVYYVDDDPLYPSDQFNLNITKGNNCALNVSSQNPWIKLSNAFSARLCTGSVRVTDGLSQSHQVRLWN